MMLGMIHHEYDMGKLNVFKLLSVSLSLSLVVAFFTSCFVVVVVGRSVGRFHPSSVSLHRIRFIIYANHIQNVGSSNDSCVLVRACACVCVREPSIILWILYWPTSDDKMMMMMIMIMILLLFIHLSSSHQIKNFFWQRVLLYITIKFLYTVMEILLNPIFWRKQKKLKIKVYWFRSILQLRRY